MHLLWADRSALPPEQVPAAPPPCVPAELRPQVEAALAGADQWEWDVFALHRLVPDCTLATVCW